MTATTDHQADELIGFHKRLTEGGLPETTASVLTIDLNKAILSGHLNVDAPEPTGRDAIASAAVEKAGRRRAQLEAGGS